MTAPAENVDAPAAPASRLGDDEVLAVVDLRTHLHTRSGPARAVDGVSFSLKEGETFALVGESGCGKSMTALSILRLAPEASAYHPSGSIYLRSLADDHGRPLDLLDLPEGQMQQIRGSRITMIFQEPMTALNPVITVGRQVAEALRLHERLSRAEARRRTVEMFSRVGIPDPERIVRAYPHQLSGGMRQRVMIAGALACHPQLLIADEPTTALDVTIQAQILALAHELRTNFHTAILLITHNLAIVYEHADRVAVMYAGQIAEIGTRDQVFDGIEDAAQHHPYTYALMQSLPARTRRGQPLNEIPGSVPPATEYPDGCRFADRCTEAQALCREECPELMRGPGGHLIACHFRRRGRAVAPPQPREEAP